MSMSLTMRRSANGSEPLNGIEPLTFSLPRRRATAAPEGRVIFRGGAA